MFLPSLFFCFIFFPFFFWSFLSFPSHNHCLCSLRLYLHGFIFFHSSSVQKNKGKNTQTKKQTKNTKRRQRKRKHTKKTQRKNTRRQIREISSTTTTITTTKDLLYIAKMSTCALYWSCTLHHTNFSFWCFSSICPAHDAVLPFRSTNSGLFNPPPCTLAIGRSKQWQKSIKTTTSGPWSFNLMSLKSFSSSRR